jgi:hypothetical protein
LIIGSASGHQSGKARCTMAFCTNCGESVESGNFCPTCGNPVKQPGAAPAAEPAPVAPPVQAGSPIVPPGMPAPGIPPGMLAPGMPRGMPLPPAAMAQRSKPASPVVLAAGAAGILFMIIGMIGSALPWATVSQYGLSKNGLSGDGMITIVFALLALGFFIIALINRAKWPFIVCAVMSGIIAVVGIYDAAKLASEISVGIGLYLVIIAGLLGLLAGIAGAIAPRSYSQ